MIRTLISISVILVVSQGIAQVQRETVSKEKLKTTEKTTTPSQTPTGTKLSKTASKPVVNSNETQPLTADQLKARIASCQKKIDYVNSNPQEKERSMASGEYQQLVDRKAGYEAELKKLEGTQK